MKHVKRVLCWALIAIVVFALFGCYKKPTETNESVPADTDWTFEEDLPSGFFFYIKTDNGSFPTDDFSDSNAMCVYRKDVYDENLQETINTDYINNLDSFDIPRHAVNMDNETQFASLALEVVFYHTAALTPYDNRANEPQNPNLVVNYVKVNPSTKEISLKAPLCLELSRYGNLSTSMNKVFTATRIRNGKTETTEVKVDFKVSTKRVDALRKVAIIEYNNTNERIKSTVINEIDFNELNNSLLFATTDDTAYVVVEREWEVPYDDAVYGLNAGETYRTRELFEEPHSDSNIAFTKFWYPTDNGLCKMKTLEIMFKQ